MKKLIILMTAFVAIGFSCESREALIIAKVVEVKTDSLTYCKAFIDKESISYYKINKNCPLLRGVTIARGIDFPLHNGHDCEVIPGDSINGVIYTKGKAVYLED